MKESRRADQIEWPLPGLGHVPPLMVLRNETEEHFEMAALMDCGLTNEADDNIWRVFLVHCLSL